MQRTEDKTPMRKTHDTEYLKGLEKKDWWRHRDALPPVVLQFLLHLDALYCLIDGLQQSPVLGVLVAVFVGKHVGQGVHIAVKVLL